MKLVALATTIGLSLVTPCLGEAQQFDLVVAGGRVIDPESGLDAVRNIGIRGGKIAAISARPLSGRATIAARGLVVAPGFIDLHDHGQTEEVYRYRALDGVTSTFELEVGVADIDAFYRERAAGRLINYGASIGHIPVRMAVFADPGGLLPNGPAADQRATDAQIEEMKRRLEAGLRAGAVGVGFGLAYTPAATEWEALEMYRVAARYRAPTFVHLRSGMRGLEEVIAASAITGAPLHVVHINSSAGGQIRQMLQIIEEAKSRGLDVTTEAYPYEAGMTSIQSALYADWQSWADERFATFLWPETGERLTRESFARYRARGGNVIGFGNTLENVAVAINSPLTMIASDAFISEGKGHPRSTGTYARVLGQYVREAKTLSLREALRKMTVLPAQRLEARVPAMKNKGRLRVGADADIVVFNPETVRDRSTYTEPTLAPAGIEHVLVNGVPVVRAGLLVEGVKPGRPLRARPSN